jgi:hypothetical protein
MPLVGGVDPNDLALTGQAGWQGPTLDEIANMMGLESGQQLIDTVMANGGGAIYGGRPDELIGTANPLAAQIARQVATNQSAGLPGSNYLTTAGAGGTVPQSLQIGRAHV